MNDDNIVSFEFFKDQKKLDEDYPKFLGFAEKVFEGKIDVESMLKRLYYAMRYLEGTIRGLDILSLLLNEDMRKALNPRGNKFIIEWLEELLMKLKG